MSEPQVLEEIVEIDKTYIGGKQSQDLRSTHYANKTMVMEAVQRGRAVRFRVERHTKQHSAVFFHRFVDDTLSDKAEHVYTDSTLLTRTSLRPIPATPASITKTRNGFGLTFKPTASSLFGRCSSGRIGSYHQPSAKHLEAYLDEFTFMFNKRNNRDPLASRRPRAEPGHGLCWKRKTSRVCEHQDRL